MRHRWTITRDVSVPWQDATVHERECERCGCLKTREPAGSFFRAVYVLAGRTYDRAPECPGKEMR